MRPAYGDLANPCPVASGDDYGTCTEEWPGSLELRDSAWIDQGVCCP